MKSLTNRRNKSTVRGSNNQVVFYETAVPHKAVMERSCTATWSKSRIKTRK